MADDNCDAYGEVEYGGECVNEDAVFQNLPDSNVEEFDTLAGRLGCGVPTVFITSRCSGSMVCQFDLKDITNLTWNRKLDEMSTAEVTIGLTGDASQTCCQCLAVVEPWCHELHIWRDGDEVWVGPIQAVKYERELVTVFASDSLAWLNVRILADDLDFQTLPTIGATGPEADLTDIAKHILTKAFEEDVLIGNNCEMQQLYTVQTGEPIQFYQEAFSDTAGDIFHNLADQTELNYTVLGRTIILIGDTLSLTSLGLLNDDHIMGDIEVVKDGAIQGNRYWIHWEGDEGYPAVSETTDRYCYSLIERIADGDGLGMVEDAEVAAASYVSASSIAPRVISIPEGSRLSPDTPWTINQMVPGARVDVSITRLCLNLTQSFLLTGMEVAYSEGDGEMIGISLSPMNSTATS